MALPSRLNVRPEGRPKPSPRTTSSKRQLAAPSTRAQMRRIQRGGVLRADSAPRNSELAHTLGATFRTEHADEVRRRGRQPAELLCVADVVAVGPMLDNLAVFDAE